MEKKTIARKTGRGKNCAFEHEPDLLKWGRGCERGGETPTETNGSG